MADKLAFVLFAEKNGAVISQPCQKNKANYKNISINITWLGIIRKEFLQQDANLAANAIIGVLIEYLLTPMQWQDR